MLMVKNEGRVILTVDPGLKHRIVNSPGGETFNFCYQCGTCTATCPIARFTKDFRPNKLIQMAKLGSREVLKSDAIWLCATCYACTEICPQGVEVKDVIRVLQNLATEEGIIPDFYKALSSNIMKTGFVNIISASILKKRKLRGLPPLPKTKLEDIERLAEATGSTKIA